MAKKQYTELTDQQLLVGMDVCYQNALNHFNNALSNSENPGLGIALFVISIEELIKANALYHCYLGLEEQETIDIAFNSKDKHRTRLKMALGIDSANQLMERLSIVNTIQNKVLNLNIELSLDELFNQEKLTSFYEKVQLLLKDEIEQLNEASKEIRNEVEQHANWFLHAQHLKEKGLYADITNHKWETPLALENKDYKLAKIHTEPIFKQIGDPIRKIIEASELQRTMLRAASKNFIEMASNKEANNDDNIG